MKKSLVFVCLLLLQLPRLSAEIDKRIIEIMQRSDAVMNNPSGVETQISAHASMVIFSMEMDVRSYSKGDRYLTKTTARMLGEEVYSEEGCDGTLAWEYKGPVGSQKRDSLIITHEVKKADEDHAVNMSVYEEYNSASMKQKNGVYEITLTQPKDKDTPKKTVVKIDAKTYYPKEIKSKMSGMTMEMKIVKIVFGVKDSVFVLDPDKYPNAVVVHK